MAPYLELLVLERKEARLADGALDSPSNPKGEACFNFRLSRPTTS